ncbi:hypothetical protein [Roseimaritima multifibrata]|nr:hypothetical protein [Roseimaritima multifibrata]
MPYFFEQDRDEIRDQGVIYLDFFNLYPELNFQPTVEHLERLSEAAVAGSTQTDDGWQVVVVFCDCKFLLDTHYHGTSTLFCAEKSVCDKTIMLAFLGCFLPSIRDHWKKTYGGMGPKPNWLSMLFRR